MQTLLHTDTFTHRHFCPQKLLHTEPFTHRSFFHAAAFAHRRFYTQTLLHTEAFTRRNFYTQKLLHTDAFTHTHKLLHTEAFYTQTLLHTEALTRRNFYTNKLLRTEAFTHRSFYAQTLLHRLFYTQKYQVPFYPSFVRSKLISCEKVAPDACKSQFLAIEPHFYQNACEMQRFSKLQLSDCQRQRPTGQRERTTGQRERDNGTTGRAVPNPSSEREETSTTCRSISGFALPSLIHNNQPLL